MRQRVRGNALILTVIICIVLSVLCLCYLQIAYIDRRTESRFLIAEQLNAGLQSGINWITSDSSFADWDTTIELSKTNGDSIDIKDIAWGLFRVGYVTSKCRTFSLAKGFFYGTTLPEDMNCCLYIADHRRSLALNGVTRLTGNVSIPQAGFVRGGINGSYFSQPYFENGKLTISQDELPKINPFLSNYLESLLSQSGTIKEELLSDSLTVSYAQPTKIIKIKNSNLSSRCLQGNILLSSDSVIHIAANNILKDIIVTAPIVKVDSGFRGKIQIIASKQIYVGPDCHFEYPSSLVLYKKGLNQGVLKVSHGCQLSGIILTMSEKNDVAKNYADLNGSFNGVVYNSGYLSLSGNVTGVVLADYYIYKSGFTTYENYLVDQELNRELLSKHFTGSPFFMNCGKRNIIQWIN